MEFIFAIAILMVSVIIHEVSHGHIANLLGDSTAKYAGRLSLNPLRHLELFGSIILPIFTYLSGGFILGWAKPVPINPYNLKNQKWGPALVGLAGPLVNLTIALIFGSVIRYNLGSSFLPYSFFEIARVITVLNLMLAIFNLMPVPPLDGSKIISLILPYKWQMTFFAVERYGFFILIIFIFFAWSRVGLPIIAELFRLITGAALLY